MRSNTFEDKFRRRFKFRNFFVKVDYWLALRLRIYKISFIDSRTWYGRSLFKNLELYSDTTISKYTLQDFRRELLEICRREVYSTLDKPSIDRLVDEVMVSLICREQSLDKVTKALWNSQLRGAILKDFTKYLKDNNSNILKSTFTDKVIEEMDKKAWEEAYEVEIN